MHNTPRAPSAFRPRTLIGLITVVCVVVGLFYFARSHSDEGKKVAQADSPMVVTQDNAQFIPADSPLRKSLQVTVVGVGTAPHAVDLPGMVEADPTATVNILSPLTGRLTALAVKLGDTVKAGQLLAVVNSGDLAQAYADADKARDALDLAQRALDRGAGVNAAGANAAKDFELIKSNFNQAQAEFTRTQHRLQALGVSDNQKATDGKSRQSSRLSQLSQFNIVSPQSGTVTAINSGVGAYLNDPAAPIMTVTNLDHVWITANVPENMVATLRLGQPAQITLSAYPGSTWQGKIGSISALLEPDTHRNKARINFANPDGRLKPNMYANVKLATAESGKLVVPSSALLMNNDSITVLVETRPWTFVRRIVTIGSEDGDQVSVLSGLRAGDRLITRGGVLIND